jgi:orotate phosphoribosyltransferase
MKQYQKEFLDFIIDSGALRFGEFTLKSGRSSPYFFNAGSFSSGSALKKLGEFYARAIIDWEQPFDMLFGPAYKGIPLVSATAIALTYPSGRDVPYAFNRKEVKDHGEGGALVGAALQGRVIIIDDVISAGLSVALSVTLIREAGAEPVAVFIALDREERAEGSPVKATQAVQHQYQIPVKAIVTLTTLIDYLQTRAEYMEYLDAVRVYQRKYGVNKE